MEVSSLAPHSHMVGWGPLTQGKVLGKADVGQRQKEEKGKVCLIIHMKKMYRAALLCPCNPF